MRCDLWIPWSDLPREEADRLLAYLRSEPWQSNFPLRWLRDLRAGEEIVSTPEDVVITRNGCDQIARFLTELAGEFPALSMSALGFYDPDPDRTERTPTDNGGVFAFSVRNGAVKLHSLPQ